MWQAMDKTKRSLDETLKNGHVKWFADLQVVLFIECALQGDSTFLSLLKLLSVTIEMEATEQYFAVVRFVSRHFAKQTSGIFRILSLGLLATEGLMTLRNSMETGLDPRLGGLE